MEPNQDWDLLFGDIATAQMARVREALVSLSVSYSTSMCTQLTMEFIDPNFEMLQNNYFIVGRDIIYKSKVFPTTAEMVFAETGKTNYLVHLFEIASVEVRASAGSSPSISVQARTKAVQQMKRDKTPGNIKGTSSDYVYWAALTYGLFPLLEKTSKSRQISKASGDKQADSTWDVLSSLASDAKFMLYETDGMLFFCSMDFLMGRWGVVSAQHNGFTNSKNEVMPSPINVVPLVWPPMTNDQRTDAFNGNTSRWDGAITSKFDGLLIPLAMPTLRRSDNDPFVVSGSVSVDRTAGVSLRPGMTIGLAGIPTFEDIYMITGVDFDHFSTNPVNIEFTKPEREGKYIQTFAVGPTFADYGTTTIDSEIIKQLRVF
jgi:hypothetical protein